MTRFANGFIVLLIILLTACGQQTQPVVITTTPSNITLLAGDPAQIIRVNLQSSAPKKISWSLTPNLGSLDTSSGLEVHYLPPTNIANETTVTVAVAFDGTNTASTSILVKPRNQANLTLTPAEVDLTAGDAAFSFTATAQNSDADVFWSLSKNIGSLNSSSGVSVKYTPPETVNTDTTLLLTAQLQGTDIKSSTTITLKPKPIAALSISPRGNPSLTLSASSPSQTFKASVQNSSDTVTWSLSPSTPNAGSLNQTSGLEVQYTPPTYVSSELQISLIARLSNGTIQDSVSITIQPLPVSLSVSPNSIVLTAGDGARSFSATLQNSPEAINWTLSPNLGSLNTTTGSSVVYTSPNDVANDTVVTLIARTADNSAEYSSTITIHPRPQPVIYITPTTNITSFGGDSLSFAASLQNATGTISWSISPNIGSLSNLTGTSVQYFPPNEVSSVNQVTITAQLSGSSVKTTTPITLRNPPSALISCSSHVIPSGNETIVGYIDKTSYLPGEAINFRVSLPIAGNFAMTAYHDGKTAELVWFKNNIAGQTRNLAAKAYAQDPAWPLTTTLTIPASWGGMYFARLINLQDQSCFTVVFIVKRSPSNVASRPPIVLLASDYHWQAYNRWGGASYYDCTAGTCGATTAPIISLRRPISTVMNDNQGSASRVIAIWLEQNGYPYDVISDSDLNSDPNALSGYSTFILPRHTEYWTTNMRDRTDQFLNQGKNLINLGGNQMYWKVVVVGGLMEVRKATTATMHTLTNELGGQWRYAGLDRPEAKVLGSQFTAVGLSSTSSGWAPYKVFNANHWALAGTNLQANQEFGSLCSGWETDKIDTSISPSNIELIARGTNIDPNVPYAQAGADMTYYNHPGGGGVFSVGSIAFFSDTCRSDPIISQIMHNVLNRFTGR